MNASTQDDHRRRGMKNDGMASGIYGMGVIGAAVYFIQSAVTFWGGVIGIVKALFWPAMLIYKLLEYLKL
jgi:hypothetical protein